MKRTIAMMLLSSIVTAGTIYYMNHGNEINRTMRNMVRNNEAVLSAIKEKMGI